MQFKCERDVLLNTVSAALRAIPNKLPVPSLRSLRVVLTGNNLEVVGSDLDLTIVARVTVAGAVDGQVLIPAALFEQSVRKLPAGAVTVGVLPDGRVLVAGGTAKYRLSVPSNFGEYPKLVFPEGSPVTVPSEVFSRAVKRVVQFVSNDASRPVLTGCFFESMETGLRIVATDSYRLAYQDVPAVQVKFVNCIVPARALVEVVKQFDQGDVQVTITDREVMFSSASLTIMSRLIEGQYPPYKNLIPKGVPAWVTVVDREEFAGVLDRVQVMARDAAPVQLNIGQDDTEVSGETQDVGQATDTLPSVTDHPESVLSVRFNPVFLASGVNACGSLKVRLRFVDQLKPCVVIPDGDTGGFFYLLMPIR